MQKQIFKTFFLFAVFLMLPGFSSAAVVFEDNFDTQADWSSKPRTTGFGTTNSAFPLTWVDYTGSPHYPVPAGWTEWQSGNSAFVTNLTSTHNVNSDSPRGGSGKSYMQNAEYYNYWTDGLMGKYLGDAGYNELYVQFWAKFDPSWFWPTTDDSTYQSMSILKMIHIGVTHDAPLTASSNPDLYAEGGTVPLWLFTINNDAWRKRTNFHSSPRHDAPYGALNDEDMNAGQGYIMWPTDGQYHLYVSRVKMNSAPGVADGEVEFWLDGLTDANHHYVRSDMAWRATSSTLSRGWNWVTLVGNLDWKSCSGTAWTEQTCLASLPGETVKPVYIDDVVISTDYKGPAYVIGGADITAPAAPNGLSVE